MLPNVILVRCKLRASSGRRRSFDVVYFAYRGYGNAREPERVSPEVIAPAVKNLSIKLMVIERRQIDRNNPSYVSVTPPSCLQ